MPVSVDVLKLTQVEGVVCVRGTAATYTIAQSHYVEKIHRNSKFSYRKHQGTSMKLCLLVLVPKCKETV